MVLPVDSGKKMYENILYTKVNKARARSYGKRVLAVRAMAGETAWLEGRMIWRDGRVVWESGRDIVVPTVATLALAQRRLAQIESYPRSANRAFGNASEWLAARRSRLELAKRLQVISEPDIESLVERAHKDPRAIGRLVDLLPAEAYCLNMLPASPAEALVALGDAAEAPVRERAGDEQAPIAGRALASMALGAIHRKLVEHKVQDIPAGRWNTRAYAWGLKHGWPADAPLVVALLAEEGGEALAMRLARIEKVRSWFLPTPKELRELMARGLGARRVVELCEARAALEPAAVRIMHYRDQLEGILPRWRREAAAALRDERLALVGDLIDLVSNYALEAADAAVIYAVAQFVTAMLELGSGNHTKDVAGSALAVLRRGLKLPAQLSGPFFELLLERFEQIWKAEDFAEQAAEGAAKLQEWFMDRDRLVFAIAQLLGRSGDAGITREAWDQGLVYSLGAMSWKDIELYRLALRLVRELDQRSRPWELFTVLDVFSTAKAARATLNPLVSALMQAQNRDTRANLAESIFCTLRSERGRVKEDALALALHVPRLICFVESPGIESGFVWLAVESAAALNSDVGEEAAGWLDKLLACLEDRGRRAELDNKEIDTLGQTLPFLMALAGDDVKRFGELARAALAHSFDYDSEPVRKSVYILKSFPALRDALGRLFPLQPHRCLAVAVKMGYVSRLGKEAYAPLGYLESTVDGETLPDEWVALASVVPGAEADGCAYVRARRLLGAAPDIPPGVRKALEEPRKLAAELTFLEEKLAAGAVGSGIEARVKNLRLRLSNDEKLMREMRAEVEERMAQISAEAQIAAAEAKVVECYRIRLEKLAGAPLPGLEINNDLVNAILLAADIDSNRKLLVKLLKAYVKGEKRWHEQHPGNRKFLAQLAAREVDVTVWLGANPRRYACKGVAGGKVRLVLERDPIRVLQMGNYFDTCLSFGKFNSFSTVANACELNKRVVYAYDGTGRVAGRKLIGIDGNGKLVGFHTYSTLGEEEGKALRDIFRRYCAGFAECCGLELADEGTVPKLFAAAWYDDGTVPWSESEEEAPRAASRKASPGQSQERDR
jgi:hypothetical protein